MERYFYQFLEEVSYEFASTLKELEHAIYNSPRSMLTHGRTFIEALLEKVMIHEDMENAPYLTIIDRIESLENNGLLTSEVGNALHEVRKLGNMAAHDTRQFRFSESLTSWEHIYTIVKWFVEVYGSYEMIVPAYVDPVMRGSDAYDLEEMAYRFQKMEELLKKSLASERPKQMNKEESHPKKSVQADGKIHQTQQNPIMQSIDRAPGLIPIRTITYEEEQVEIPHFLRDAFLLPQRFPGSERFLIRLGGEQEARIISELPSTLKGFHERITRYDESHSETFFNELRLFVAEEIRRRELIRNRPGELFLFYNGKEIVVTVELGKIAINKENFTGFPGLIDQLNTDGMERVSDLPKELIIIGKYKGVGKSRVDSFFKQLKAKQMN